MIFAFTLSGMIHPVRADSVLPPMESDPAGDATPPSVGFPPSIIPTEADGRKTRPSGPTSPAGGFQIMAPIPPTIITNPQIDMKVLVLHNPTWDFGNFPTITAYLDILGIPYDTIDTGTTPITTTTLADGNHGKYYAIFFTFSGQWWDDLGDVGRAVISDYERNFGVRQVTLYIYPDAGTSGLEVSAVPTETLTATLTTDGQLVFPYLKSDIQLVKRAEDYAYPGTPAAGADVTTLLEDQNGNVALSIFRPGDGREHMVFTWPNFYPATIPAFLYSRTLPYGIINWATKGIFLGQRHVYFVPQPDDVFSWGDIWDPVNHVLLENAEYYRLEPDDLDNIVNWMEDLRANIPNAADFKMEMPFNGEGTQYDRQNGSPSGTILTPTLTARAIDLQNEFIWLNHTFTHRDLYTVSYNVARNEIDNNNNEAAALGLTDYTSSTLLTGAYSGLTNTNVINAAYDLGVRYLLANASDPEYNNPTPNTGIPHPSNGEVLLVPRNANNIFYFATNRKMEVDYYNWVYCPNYAASGGAIAPCYTYEASVDAITNQALGNLLDFNVNATMFHMNNLDAYNAPTSTVTLLSDYVESLYGKYNALYGDVPILSLRTQEIGDLMWERMTYDASAVSAVWSCGDAITVTTTNAARVPVTGISYGGDTETYAGQNISYFDMAADDTLFIPGATASVPEQISGLFVVVSGAQNVLTWNPIATDTNGTATQALFYRVYRGDILLADRVTTTTYTDTNPITGAAYTVTAIGDNCWKRESAGASATPTTLLDFSASTLAGTVTISWTTDIETNTTGFNLYISTNPSDSSSWTLVNSEIIASNGSHVYTYTDPNDRRDGTFYYQLEEVETADTGSAQLRYPSISIGIGPNTVSLVGLQAQASFDSALVWFSGIALAAGSALGIKKRRKVR